MILNTIIMNLLGNSSYKKYISIVSGMILVLIVISPLFNLLKLNDKLDYFLQFNDFSLETSDFKNNLNNMEKQQSDSIFNEYQKKLKKQVKGILAEENINLKTFQITFDRDAGSDTFGKLTSMTITADYHNTAGTSSKKEKIDIETIERIEIDRGEEKTIKKIPSPLEIRIKNKLSDFYNIKAANINISIQGG